VVTAASAALLLTTAVAGHAQSFNFDFDAGSGLTGPPATYAAAGIAGHWNAIPAEHGTTTADLLDVGGASTSVTLRQIGGLALAEQPDAAIGGDDALLMDDFLVTFSSSLESCIFLDELVPGTYEVLIYARMPDPAVGSYTSVDQEAGQPHLIVGGVWPGAHAAGISYSRHLVQVGTDGELNLHSGVVPGADPQLGAALNALQVQLALFADGFDSGDTAAWSATAP
jgi:hypothetical protein